MSQLDTYVTSFEGLLEIATDLIEGWETFVSASDKFTFGQRKRRPDEMRFISVYGLAAHVHGIWESASHLLREDLTLHAAPLVRLMYESALTSIWLAQTEDGAGAFMNKELASRKAVASTLRKGSAAWMRNRAQDFPGLEDPKFESSSDAQAKNFEQLCSDLVPGGAEAYVYYRLLSRLSHASPQIVDRYVFADADMEFEGLRASIDRGRDSRDLVSFLAVASLVWAGTAVDYIDPQRSRQTETRKAARKIGIPRDLHLTPTAFHRSAPGRTNQKRSEDARRRSND